MKAGRTTLTHARMRKCQPFSMGEVWWGEKNVFSPWERTQQRKLSASNMIPVKPEFETLMCS